MTLILEPDVVSAWDVYRSTPKMSFQSTLLARVKVESVASKDCSRSKMLNLETEETPAFESSSSKYRKSPRWAALDDSKLKHYKTQDLKDLKVLAEEPWKWRTNLTGLELKCSSKDVSNLMRCFSEAPKNLLTYRLSQVIAIFGQIELLGPRESLLSHC